MNQALLSSKSVEWGTPEEIFRPLDREFRFEIDACATAENKKCDRFWSPDDDGLRMPWAPFRIWCNPPYGRQIAKWVRKAYEESLAGATVVMLIPARTDTAWWHDYVAKAEIRFLRGRVYFISPGKKRDRAPFPSAVVVFRGPKT